MADPVELDVSGAVSGSASRQLYHQSIAGCLDGRIGAHGLDRATLSRWLDQTSEPLAKLKAAHADGSLPLLRLPREDADIVAAEAALKKLSAGAKMIVFLGIGGSSLGGQALAQLAGWNIPGAADAEQRSRPRTRFYDNLDASTLDLAFKDVDLATTRFVVTSKSGGTSETLVQVLAALKAVDEAGLGARSAELFLGITEPARPGVRNGLRELLSSRGIPILDHPTGIGGRYSALTVVGLVPAMARGLDPRALRGGADVVLQQALAASHPSASAPAVGAALAVALAREKATRVMVFMSYADRLQRLGAWYVQLWAESLGKGGQGTTPLGCLGPLDQHSQLQLFMDGPREHALTVLRVKNGVPGPRIDPALAKIAGLDVMGGRTVSELVAAQAEAVPEALNRAGRPVRTIDIERLDAATLGGLMMHFMIETILAGWLMGLDPFDQPAVELAKVLTRERLSR
ncbi:MAG TPA: glucose-6-phosphate isomerase [Hyphomicrobiaceae bacterium]|nr:glucose-6-phosphate isomerase [Hyphomicrobiaceae bacterium]